MNAEYKRLKQTYDDLGDQISKLHEEQGRIRELMEQACTHEHLYKVESNPFLADMDLEEEETKYKCLDCYQYFLENELR